MVIIYKFNIIHNILPCRNKNRINLIMVTRFRINVYVCNFKINHLKKSSMIDKKNKNYNKKNQLTFFTRQTIWFIVK